MDKLSFSLTALTMGIIVGTVLFQSAVVAPTVFTSLEPAQASRFLRTLFPRFFRVNLGLALVAAVAIAAGGATSGWSVMQVWSAIAAAVMALSMALAAALVPAVNRARDRGEVGAARFRSLHRTTVLLTLLTMLLAIAVLLAIAATSAGY